MPPVVQAGLAPKDVTMVVRSIQAGRREVELCVAHTGPALRDATAAIAMKVWGDVDLNCNARIEPTEGGSEWLPYFDRLPLVLSAGAGTKTVNVRLRGRFGTTDTITHTIEVGDEPHASLLWSAYKLNSATLLGWSPSVACTAYRFAMCSNEFDTFDEHEPFLEGGALTAGQYVEVAVPAHDASHIIVKMFIQVAGIWYG